VKEIIAAVKKQLPKFNEDIIRGIRTKEIDGAVDFIVERIREAILVIGEDVELMGWQTVSPYERAIYEINNSKISKSVSIYPDEVILIKFIFRFETTTFEKLLYIPYIFEDYNIVVGGTKYTMQLNMTEKLFSKMRNGVTIKVIRSPISFWKDKLFNYTGVVSDKTYTDTVITTKIHYRKSSSAKNKLRPTVIHYLICKFGFEGTLDRLNIPRDQCLFVQNINKEDTETFEYFRAQSGSSKQEGVYLKINKELLKKVYVKRFVASILYVMTGFRKIHFDTLISDSTTMFKIWLGKIIYNKNTGSASALNYMDSHIESFDNYLDTLIRTIFHSEGIMVNDIYDLLVYIFFNIDEILLKYPNNNFYNKKINILNAVIIDTIVTSLYTSIYKHEKNKNSKNMLKVVSDMLAIFPRHIIKKMNKSVNVKFNANYYNDNGLISIWGKMTKRLGSSTASGNTLQAPVNRFHTSFITTESMVGFSSANPDSNALINPFVVIDENGGVLKTKFSDRADRMNQFLPD